MDKNKIIHLKRKDNISLWRGKWRAEIPWNLTRKFCKRESLCQKGGELVSIQDQQTRMSKRMETEKMWAKVNFHRLFTWCSGQILDEKQ